jgi:hypothetical protein
MTFLLEQLIFQPGKSAKKQGPLNLWRIAILPGDQLLAAKTAGKADYLPIRPPDCRRHAMGPADQQTMPIQLAESVGIEGTHDLWPLASSSRPGTLSEVLFSPGPEFFLPAGRQSQQTKPEICPLNISMVKEIRITAIVRTAGTGKA